MIKFSTYFLSIFCILLVNNAFAQKMQWTADGNAYYSFSAKGIDIVDLLHPDQNKPFLTTQELIPKDSAQALEVQSFQVSPDGNSLLLFANTQRVWRDNTRGDYWIFDKKNKKLVQLGKGLPVSSLMFAKFSPDGKKVAYVSKHNIYIEDLSSNTFKAITKDGTDRIINGTFDWAYEEEFGCQDGFRWSPDGTKIAYWKLDAKETRNFLMINNTDSLYSFTIPVEYPKVGMNPSSCTIWFYNVSDESTQKAGIEGDDIQHYIPRMEWVPDSRSIILQQLNRKQNVSKIIVCDAVNATSKTIHQETDEAWIDIKARWNNGDPSGWDWINEGKEFIWLSEKNGWRQIYKIDMQGKETLITKDNYDVIQLDNIDQKADLIYFSASPTNATQKFLYKIGLNGGAASRVTPAQYKGTNTYTISSNGKLAIFNSKSTTFSSTGSVVTLPEHKEIAKPTSVKEGLAKHVEFIKIKTQDSIELDGWMVKPKNFDPAKKYPVVFYVYGEPAAQTVTDDTYTGYNPLYTGNMSDDGYIYISLENRGAPAPKGRVWRKSIYRNIGRLNIRDQAMGAKEILKWNFVDPERVAVWGWSGGGSSTLNLLGQYPEIYKTGISIAPVTNQLFYDNIYQERYMGLPQENKEDFLKGSPVSYVKNLKGNLLLIHGTGDDNVHYQNTEVYINEMVKYNKQFQLMSYPNRSHSINEGAGTTRHLSTLFTKFLKTYCPPGAK
ncbi:DPP IV N-terminal domain-containing protein [Sphingobacterium spiritivorum]|uniref:Peptidase, S9A/B/C family, catalytic domain protein n=1 Tax=Sphingobacterium spiritivorum ATCC 33861 TaxID=525373 RepID=D7VPC8_SPHSI|nr:DPP IV N-terminal domain-containing protein [Sphingobacterium spiritivorum]EFK57775.1 peptidase, S9A/B/C family, catalytic domain protein [Sphingobacterium spiritivorum ATCC 33861]QQT36195.1 DPP IV N-terminal domain-containing protein [Sphingobacterium spiritivorum]WQD32932.1 DPP IV N-terminal domain-containing protein [Sphingobacterium spiritivorum]SUJ16381.1 Prolyl tripeptidyl peptidase precursor [Sphingobacterium spiritivorum]